MCSILLEYGFSPSISRPLQNILSNQPELPKRIFYNHLTKRQLPEVALFNPLLQLAAGIGFIRNVPPRLRNRQRFASTIENRRKPLILKVFRASVTLAAARCNSNIYQPL